MQIHRVFGHTADTESQNGLLSSIYINWMYLQFVLMICKKAQIVVRLAHLPVQELEQEL